MRRITPHLWFDREAKEAVRFYTSLFPGSRTLSVTTLPGVPTPTWDSDTISWELGGHPFIAINAGPLFKFNPSISFMVNFDPSRDPGARANLEAAWKGLSEGGTALMPLGSYFFSDLYGWIQDRYGLSWQLILTKPEGEEKPFVIPSLMFAGGAVGRAEEAMDFFCSIFPDGKRGITARYGEGQEPDREGTIMFADFNLMGTWLAAMDSARMPDLFFNEAVSLVIPCETQKEIDYYWEKLSAVPEAEQCGWLKDRFGISWQVTPAVMEDMMAHGTEEQIARLTRVFLPMKKLDIAALKKAYHARD